MCEYGLTSQFAHRWASFFVGRAYSESFLCRTPVRSSSRHDSIRLNIMIIFLPDRRNSMINKMIIFLLGHRNIMITIMTVFLPRNVRVCTIMKDKGCPSMHEHTIKHEILAFFHYYYHVIQPRKQFVHIISFFISFHISSIMSFMHTSELYFMLVRRFACHSYHIIQIT